MYAAQRRASLKAPNLLKIQRKRVKKEKKDDGNESDDSVEDCLSDEEEEEDEDDELLEGLSEDDRIDGRQWEREYAEADDSRSY